MEVGAILLTDHRTNSLEIYVGSPIAHESERAVLEHIVHLLLPGRGRAFIFANLNVGGRQIDLILVLDGKVLLIEAKGYTRPVSGGSNGYWCVRVASGRTKNVDNAYLQALGAKNALRDAMRTIGLEEAHYPHAAVVFVPDIPLGSSVTEGDFKVSVIGLSALGDEIGRSPSSSWSTEQWRAFARHNNLRFVPSVDAACDPALFRGEELVAGYLSEYRRTYGPVTKKMVGFTCISGGQEISSDQIVEQVVEKGDFILVGPSGCGKSLLAYQCGMAVARNREVPITVSAKEFGGSLKAVMDREIGLMAPCSAGELLATTRKLNRSILLIVDGYNECDESQRAALTRSIAAISKRFEMRVLITSRLRPVRQDLLSSLSEINVPATEQKVKVAIALDVMSRPALSPDIEALIDSVASGLEAGLVGEVGHDAGVGVSRYGLFDAYARKRLRTSASDGIRALSLVAGWLSDRLALSLTVRDLDRLAEAEGIQSSLLVDITNSGLLGSRGARVSFGHEQFYHAFAAEAVIRRADGSAEEIASALRHPRHSDERELIVGAIDDGVLLMRVLEQVSDASVLAACILGRCGRNAKMWAEDRMANVVSRMLSEAGRACFNLDGDTWWNASVDPECLTAWSAQDDAFIQCLPQLLGHGRYLDEVFDVVAALDKRIEAAIESFRRQDPPRKGVRNSIFAVSYVLGSPGVPAIARVCRTAHSGLAKDAQISVSDLHRMLQADLSWGQVYLLICLYRHVAWSAWKDGDASTVASYYAALIKNHWRALPYHLKLALVDGAGYCRRAEDPELSMLVGAVESLLSNDDPFFNSMVFDVLQRLRPFSVEEEAHEVTVRDQLDRVLSSDEDEGVCQEAFSIYICQFDHPYSGAYCEVLNELAGERRNKLLRMAIKGAQEDVNFFLPLLMRELTTLNDRSIAPSLRRWTALPKRESVSPQNAIEVFLFAHVVLGRLAADLPLGDGMTSSDVAAAALVACGVILYWCNREDLVDEDRRLACRSAWDVLNRHETGAAMSAVKDCAEMPMTIEGFDRSKTSIVTYFPAESAELCRQALNRPNEQVGYFPYYFDTHPRRVLSFAIRVLARHGRISDTSLLMQFVDDPEIGREAISAVREIGERSTSTSD